MLFLLCDINKSSILCRLMAQGAELHCPPCSHRALLKALFSFGSRERRSFLIPELGCNPWPAAQDVSWQRDSGLRGSSPCNFHFILAFKFDPNHFPEPTCQDCCPDGQESASPAAKSRSQGMDAGMDALPALPFLIRSHKPPKKQTAAN